MKIKVLLVDDEKEYVESLSERLQIRDFDVDMAFSGQSALEKIQERDYDVIVLDVLMPSMDGLKTFEKIKKINPLLHVMFVTGHAKVETAVQGMSAGVFDYLIKPVDINELIEKIEMAHLHKTVLEQQNRQKNK
ncbi:response regulator [bacterium]|nr:response regulator [bacterium]